MNWEGTGRELDARGRAVLENLLTPHECEALALLYDVEDAFRSLVVMARHGFGRGEYKGFDHPLPEFVTELRTALDPRLAPLANRWITTRGVDVRYPEMHADLLARCQEAG